MSDSRRKGTDRNIQAFMREVEETTGVSNGFLEKTRPALERVFSSIPENKQSELLMMFREATTYEENELSVPVRDSLNKLKVLFGKYQMVNQEKKSFADGLKNITSPEARSILCGYGGLCEKKEIVYA